MLKCLEGNSQALSGLPTHCKGNWNWIASRRTVISTSLIGKTNFFSFETFSLGTLAIKGIPKKSRQHCYYNTQFALK